MVKNIPQYRIFYWILLLSILWLPSASFAKDPELEISVSRTQLELGKSFVLIFTSPQLKTSLNDIDLSSLSADFYINDLAEISVENNHQQRKLILYPRKTGLHTIPEFTFLTSKTKAITLKVTPPIDSKNNSPIGVQTAVSTLNPWKKQQLLVKYTFTTKSAIVVFNSPNASSSHSDIVPISISSTPVVEQNRHLTRHTLGWAIFPRQAGYHQLNLPAIHFIRDGVTTHRFYPPLLNLNVKDLPVYIPSTMPVGKIEIDIIDMPPTLLLSDTLDTLRFKVTGYGLQASSLPVLRSQFKSTASISSYPPEISVQTVSTGQGIQAEATYDLNFKANHQGWYDFTNIHYSYFDPETGTIKSSIMPLGHIISLHSWFAITSGILLLIMVYRIARKFVQWINLRWQRYNLYKKALLHLQNAPDPYALKHCLRLISQAECWPENMTIRQWCHRSEGILPDFNLTPLKQLEMAIYKNSGGKVNNVQNELINLCYRRQKVLRWLGTTKQPVS